MHQGVRRLARFEGGYPDLSGAVRSCGMVLEHDVIAVSRPSSWAGRPPEFSRPPVHYPARRWSLSLLGAVQCPIRVRSNPIRFPDVVFQLRHSTPNVDSGSLDVVRRACAHVRGSEDSPNHHIRHAEAVQICLPVRAACQPCDSGMQVSRL